MGQRSLPAVPSGQSVSTSCRLHLTPSLDSSGLNLLLGALLTPRPGEEARRPPVWCCCSEGLRSHWGPEHGLSTPSPLVKVSKLGRRGPSQPASQPNASLQRDRAGMNATWTSRLWSEWLGLPGSAAGASASSSAPGYVWVEGTCWASTDKVLRLHYCPREPGHRAARSDK